MKKILIIPFLFLIIKSFGQAGTPPNYIKLNVRYDWIEGKFSKTLHFPAGGTTPTLYGGWNGAGAPYWDSVAKKLRIWDGTFFRTYSDSVYKSGTDLIIRYGTRTDTVSGLGGGAGTITGTSDNLLTVSGANLNNRKTFANLTYGATTTWDLTTGYNKALTLTGDANLVFTNAQNGDHCFLLLFQDGTGGHELTVPDQIIQIGTDPNDTTILQGIYNGTSWWFATSGGSLTSITGLITAGSGITVTGSGTGASPYNIAFNSPFTWGTGLTNTANTITDNLATGKAGGQTASGGTAASENLTLQSTTNATKGNTYIGSSTKFIFDEANTEFRIGNSADQGAYSFQNGGNGVTGMGATNSEVRLANSSNTAGTSNFMVVNNSLTEIGRLRGYGSAVGGTIAGISNNNATELMSNPGLAAPLFLRSVSGDVHIVTNGTTPNLTAKQSGAVGINKTSPTALLHIAAGTATANTAPLKIDPGVKLTTPESGAIESDTTGGVYHLYWTSKTPTRYQLDQQISIGTINSQTKSSDGAVSTGASLVMQTVDHSKPGLLTATDKIRLDSNSYFKWDSTYSPIGGKRNDSTAIFKSLRIQVNSTTVTPSNQGDSAMSWNLTGLEAYQEGNVASGSTITPAGDQRINFYDVTALAANPTFAAPSGSPSNHNYLEIRIKDNGTSRTITWNAIYRAGTDIALPTATTISKTMYCAFRYNSADSKWDFIGNTNGF